MDSPICYSQRLLNPFRGSVNVIRYKSAEAVSTDGINWDIYVSNEDLVKDLDCNEQIQISDVRYGKWSEAKGLTRGPIFPSDDFRRMEQTAAVVYKHLLKVHTQIPFPFSDTYELWLLDKHHNPLALLNSAVSPEMLNEHQLLDWRAGQLCKKTFTPNNEITLPDKIHEATSAADYLCDYINSLADEPPVAQWFERSIEQPQTKGLAGFNLPENLYHRVLNHNDFPEMMLNTENFDLAHTNLVNQFTRWHAPWLLVLQNLDHAQREEYEQLARNQALLVDQYFHLYPEIINQAEINAARVEAMMRNSQPQKQSEEDVMSTFYIELNPSPTE